MATTHRPVAKRKSPRRTSDMLRESEEKQRAIANSDTNVTGKDIHAESEKMISEKALEKGEQGDEKTLDNIRGETKRQNPVATNNLGE